MDVRRVHPNENANAVAVAQVARLVRRLSTAGPVPLFVCDAGYDAVALQRGLGSCRAALLVRLRCGRCFSGDPPVLPPRPQGGRPFRHGHKLVCADPATWPTPTDERVVEDGQYGMVRLRARAGLHPKLQDRTGHGTKGPSPIVPMTLVLVVEVSRLPGRPSLPQVLWLWLHAPDGYTPDLDLLWRASVRRSACSAGTPSACGTPSRPTAGPGSSSPPPPSCASLARSSPTAACPGSVLIRRVGAPRTASAARFRHCCWRSARPPARHNPAAARPGGPRAVAPAPRPAIRPSRRPPNACAHRATPSPRRFSQPARPFAWLNYKLKGLT